MFGGVGPTELILIFAVVMLLFGASKLPELARSMGSSVGEFKKAQNASIISLLEPVSAIFFAYLILNDPVSRATLFGCVLILASSLLMGLESESKT